MQRLSGLLLLLAGAGLGAYAFLPAPQDGEQRLAEVTRISAAPDRDLRSAPIAGQPVALTPATTIISKANAADAGTNPVAAAVPAAIAPAVTGALSVAQQIGGWSTVVTPETSASGKITSSKPGDGETRAQLARDLQRELKRVGCYGGEITGNWSSSTQRAMTQFMDRVNATLPVDEPDYILLTLVQGHAAAACGADCPSGQVQSDGGKCVPRAVVAQATRKSEREQQQKLALERKASDERRVAEDRKVADERRIADAVKTADDQRVAEDHRSSEERRIAGIRKAAGERRIADAREAEAAAAKAAEKASGKITVAAAAVREELPWLDTAPRRPAAAVTATSRPEPLPGMMTVGGPRVAAAGIPDTSAMSAKIEVAPHSSNPVPEVAEPVEDSAPPPSAAPVLVEPDAQDSLAKSQVRSGSQGLPGSKSGVTVRKSVQHAPPPSTHPIRPHGSASVHRAPPSKPKYNYYASNNSGSSGSHPRRYYTPRSGSTHYNMMQAYSGMY